MHTVMKSINNKALLVVLLPLLHVLMTACTDQFEELNTDPVNPQVGTIDGFMAGVQYFEFTEPRFVAWRGNLIYTSHFANQFSYGAAGDFFGEINGYSNNQSWTDGIFDASYQRVSGNLRNLLGAYLDRGDAEGAAVTRIMMSWFYQKMTDMYGDIPYSDVIGSELRLENPLTAYDPQQAIYRGIIESLTEQMDVLNGATATIAGSNGDYVYGGNPQSWRAFANTLRLRMAIRARDAFLAAGEQGFVDGVITDCLNNPLIDESNEALVQRSRTALELSFLDGGFEDVWHSFGAGGKWVLADRFANRLQQTNDPRLFEMADPGPMGGYNGASVVSRAPVPLDNLAIPSVKIVGVSGTDLTGQLSVQLLTAAESYFLQAEAALLGFSGNANALYQNGIMASMNFWGVPQAAIDTYLANEAAATLSGATPDQLRQVWEQRWVANLTNGYEAWALVRRTDIVAVVSDDNLYFVTPPNNGRVPRRLQYSTSEQASNAGNVEAAITRQGGANEMTTPVWWDVN